MSAIEGLKYARKLIREIRLDMKGETDSYARGWRQALYNLDELIQTHIKAQIAQSE